MNADGWRTTRPLTQHLRAPFDQCQVCLVFVDEPPGKDLWLGSSSLCGDVGGAAGPLARLCGAARPIACACRRLLHRSRSRGRSLGGARRAAPVARGRPLRGAVAARGLRNETAQAHKRTSAQAPAAARPVGGPAAERRSGRTARRAHLVLYHNTARSAAAGTEAVAAAVAEQPPPSQQRQQRRANFAFAFVLKGSSLCLRLHRSKLPATTAAQQGPQQGSQQGLEQRSQQWSEHRPEHRPEQRSEHRS